MFAFCINNIKKIRTMTTRRPAYVVKLQFLTDSHKYPLCMLNHVQHLQINLFIIWQC